VEAIASHRSTFNHWKKKNVATFVEYSYHEPNHRI
jgi:hypothetical protein